MDLKFSYKSTRATVRLNNAEGHVSFRPRHLRVYEAMHKDEPFCWMELPGNESALCLCAQGVKAIERLATDLLNPGPVAIDINKEILGISYCMHPLGWPKTQHINSGVLYSNQFADQASMLFRLTRKFTKYSQPRESTVTILGTEPDKYFTNFTPCQIKTVTGNGNRLLIELDAHRHPNFLWLVLLVLSGNGAAEELKLAVEQRQVKYLAVNNTIKTIITLTAPYAKRRHMHIYGFHNLAPAVQQALDLKVCHFQSSGGVLVEKYNDHQLQGLRLLML